MPFGKSKIPKRKGGSVPSDPNARSAVADNFSAVAYLPQPTLEAVKYGVDVILRIIDDVEAAEETVTRRAEPGC